MSERALRWRRPLSIVASVALVFAASTWVGSDDAARALPENQNVAINCYLKGSPVPIDLPAFACPTNDGFYGNYVYPSVKENGSLDDSLESTLMAVMAIGGRGQPAYTPPMNWLSSNAQRANAKIFNSTSDLGPVDYVKTQGAAVCQADPGNIALIARIGYVLSAVGEQPLLEGCDITAIVEGAFNPATGAYGPNLDSTMWAINFIVAQHLGFAGQALTRDFVTATNALEGGGWTSDGTTVDVVLTSRAIMALLGLGEDPLVTAIESGFDAMAGIQNEDGGWSSPTSGELSCSVPTVYVNSAVRAAIGAGAAVTVYNKFTKGEWPLGSGGRMGFQWPLLWEGLTYENPGSWRVYVEPEWNGRFVSCWGTGEESDYETLSDEELAFTNPTTTVVFYAHFYDPILNTSDEPVTPGGTVVPTGTAVSPAVAEPTVTG